MPDLPRFFPGGRAARAGLGSLHPDDPCGRDRSKERRRRSNRPRKLSGKRTAGGWVSGKWQLPATADAHRRSKPDPSGVSFRSPDRGGRERRALCVVLARSDRALATLTETSLAESTTDPLKRTPLHALHKELGA